MTDTVLPVDSPPTTSSIPAVASVTAVVVTRGSTPYLATTLRALARQTRAPLHVLLVDAATQPDDRPAQQLQAAFTDTPGGVPVPALRVVRAPGARTFGAAVHGALAEQGTGTVPTTWLWLLHDDSAPEPTALAELLRAVGHAPSVAVAGVKQHTWTSPRRLLEVGLRTSRSGRRMTDVEPGELDQGQHDGREDVLGVGLAGALVRRDVWDDLGGTDPALGPYGDGLDLSRRARLAGHRVIVVPTAVVRHAQASYLGLREAAAAGRAGRDRDGDGEDDAADPRRSFGARRRALLHLRLTSAPLPLVPVVAVLALVVGVVRGLLQVAAKQPGLAVDELRAPVAVLLRPAPFWRARRTARRTRRLARRALRPLQADWRDVWSQWRDRRLARAEARRVVRAPSELELRELAALSSRRRVTLAVLVAVLLLVSVVGLGALAGPVLGGARLAGRALAPAAGRLGDLWDAATSGWVAGGLGQPGPADALAEVLVVPTAVAGGSAPAAVAALLLGAVLLSGLGAWAASGAATRSVGVRAWAALVWAAAPVLLLALGDGRLGPVLAHAALPWVALGVVRAVGAQRVDQVLSGLATARLADPADEHDDRSDQPRADPGAAPDPAGAERFGTPDPTGSITAAAGAALAFAVAVAGAPVLLVPGVLALLVVALAARRRRGRLLLVAVPGLVLLGPTLVEAARRGSAGLRLLVADPSPAPYAPVGAVDRLLGLPADPSALVPSLLDGVGDGVLATAWPLLPGGVVLLLAVLALLRGAPAARAVRAGWLVAALGLAAGTVAAAVPVTVADGVRVPGWSGPALSLAWAGLLAAAVLGADRLRARLAHHTFGWRQLVSGLVAAVAVLVPVLWTASWAWQARDGRAVSLRPLDGAVVSAVGQQAQDSPLDARVLAMSRQADGSGEDDGVVTWQLWRGDGPLLADGAAATSTRALDDDLLDPAATPPDDADAEVGALVARLATAASGDVAGELAALAVADVVVPPVPADVDPALRPATEAARDDLVSRLDATAGLERVTENVTGTVWRVAASGDLPEVVPAWARLLPSGSDIADPATPAVPVEAEGRMVDTRVPAGNGERLLVLAERADPAWRAWLDGRPLRAVDAGWRQTFVVGPEAGRLVVRHDPVGRTPWLVVQGAVMLVTVLLAVPVRRRRAGRS